MYKLENFFHTSMSILMGIGVTAIYWSSIATIV